MSAWEDVPTPQAPRAAPKGAGGWEDVPDDGLASKINTGINWAGTQFAKGAAGLAALPTTVQEFGNAGAKYALEKVLGPGQAQTPMTNTMPSGHDISSAFFKATGAPEVNAGDNPTLTLKKPFGLPVDVNVGKLLDAGAQAVPGGMAFKAVTPGMTSSIFSEGAGQATEGTPYETPARIGAALLGQTVGAKIATPLPANLTPEQARLVGIAKEQGIPMTVGQETGRLRGVESALARFPTSGGQFAASGEKQAVALNKSALKEMGAPPDIERLDPNSMTRAFQKASNDFETAKNSSGPVSLTPNFYNSAQGRVATYLENTPQTGVVPAVEKRLEDFLDPKLMTGNSPYPQLSGTQYQEFRRSINNAAQSTTDIGAKRALQGIRNDLDDAMQSSLPADKAQAWQDARRNWAQLKTLSRATAGGSVGTRAEGNLSPSALTGALKQSQGADRFAQTEGGLNDVARLAGYLADTRPNSGTPATLAMQGMLTGGPAVGGYMAAGPAGAALAGGAMVAPNLLARMLTGSKGAGFIRDYLANQKMADNPAQLRLLQSLLAGGQ